MSRRDLFGQRGRRRKCYRTVTDIARELGRLDTVVNAAAIAIKYEAGTAFAKPEDYQRIININLRNIFRHQRDSKDHTKAGINLIFDR